MIFGSIARTIRPTTVGAAALLALALAGCSDDSSPGGATPSGPTASTTSSATPRETGTDTATPFTPAPNQAEDCAAVKGVLTSVSTRFPDGPTLTVGQPPTESNIGALTAIRDGFAALTPAYQPVVRRIAASVAAINTILLKPTASLTQSDVDAFNNAGTRLSSACVGTS